MASSNYQLNLLANSTLKNQIQGIRINPGYGTGETKKTTVAGPGYSFGIWIENLDQTLKIIQEHNIKIKKIHSHIGAGNDPNNWL